MKSVNCAPLAERKCSALGRTMLPFSPINLSLVIFVSRMALIATTGSACSDDEITQITDNINRCSIDLVDRYFPSPQSIGRHRYPQNEICFILNTFETACSSLAKKCADQIDVEVIRANVKGTLSIGGSETPMQVTPS